MPNRVDVISRHFGSELVLDEHGERISFADAWANPRMRMRAGIAASTELIHQFREAVKMAGERGTPTTDAKMRMDHLVMISELLVGALSEESGTQDEE